MKRLARDLCRPIDELMASPHARTAQQSADHHAEQHNGHDHETKSDQPLYRFPEVRGALIRHDGDHTKLCGGDAGCPAGDANVRSTRRQMRFLPGRPCSGFPCDVWAAARLSPGFVQRRQFL
jgi:hypothetical protein